MLAKGIYSKIYLFLYPLCQCKTSGLPQQNCLAQKQSLRFPFLSHRDWQLAGLFSKAFRHISELPVRGCLYVSQHDHSKCYNTLLARAWSSGKKIADPALSQGGLQLQDCVRPLLKAKQFSPSSWCCCAVRCKGQF